jgi:twitching motility protein PilT
VEVLTNSPTVRKLIDAGETSELYAAMRDGRHYGMNTLNQALERFVALGEITEQEAVQAAGNPTELRQMLRKA